MACARRPAKRQFCRRAEPSATRSRARVRHFAWLLVASGHTNGCQSSDPYQIRLHARATESCDLYEAPLIDAIDLWHGFGVDTFSYDGCEIDVFEARPEFRWLPEYRPYTKDLRTYSSHVPIYIVEQIWLDQGAYESWEPRGSTMVSETPWCPALVAVDLASVGLLAHELGHLLWLHHAREFGNVMYPTSWPEDPADISVTEDQLHDAHVAFDQCKEHSR